MRSKSTKIISKWCLERGLDSSAKKVRKNDPPELSQEGSRSSESAVFTFSLLLQKVAKNEQKKLSKWRPKALKKLSGEGLKNMINKLLIFDAF